MKKAGTMFIKNLRYLCLVGVIALGLMTIVGTGGGGGGGGTTPSPTTGSGLFVIGGVYTALYTSDGSSTTQIPSLDGSAATYYGISAGNGLIVLVGVDQIAAPIGEIACGTDLNGTFTRSPLSGEVFRDVAFGNGSFVAVSTPSQAARVWTFSNCTGLNRIDFSPADWLSSVTFGNGTFVMSGNDDLASNHTFWYSLDNGATWADTSLMADSIRNVRFGNNTFVAVGRDSNVTTAWVSADGINWTGYSMVVDGDPLDVAYGNGRWVAVGGARVWWSDDNGITWQSKAVTSNHLWAIAFGNGLFIAVGDLGTVLTSSDGENWTTYVHGGHGLRSIAYIP